MKKKILLAMAAACSIAVLTGCQSNKPAETTPAATTTAASGTTGAAETTAAAQSGETTTAAAAAEIDPNSRLAKIKASGKLVMGTSPDFAPWEFKNVSAGKTEYVGSDIELAKYIAEKLGVTLEIKPLEFSAIQQAVISGTIDIGISGFAHTPEREEALGLTERFNKNSEKGQGLLVLKDQVADYATAEDFSGKKVAAQNASLQQNLVQGQLPEDVTLQTITAVTDGVMMLVTGKVDAVAVSGDNGDMLANTYPEIAMAEFMFDYSSEGNVAAVQKGEDELLAAVNEIIQEVNEKGLYEQWKADATALAESLGIETN